MKRRIFIALAACCAVVFTIALFGTAEAARTLKYGLNAKLDQSTGKAATLFAEIVKKKTNGEIEIQVFPANQLGNNRQMVENTKMGAQDLVTLGLAGLAYLQDEYMMMQIPYVFRSQEHIRKVLDGDIGKDLRETLLKKQGIYLLAQDWDRMVRHIGGKKPIKDIKDFQGYKVRAGVLPPIAGFKAMGASPVNIPLDDMYLALQQGVVDGAELPVDYFYDYSIFEVAKYLNLTYHTYGTEFVGINKSVWESLSPAHKKALEEAAAEAGDFNNKLSAELEGDYMKKLQAKGMEIVKTDVESMRKAMMDKIGDIFKNWPSTEAVFKRIQDVK